MITAILGKKKRYAFKCFFEMRKHWIKKNSIHFILNGNKFDWKIIRTSKSKYQYMFVFNIVCKLENGQVDYVLLVIAKRVGYGKSKVTSNLRIIRPYSPAQTQTSFWMHGITNVSRLTQHCQNEARQKSILYILIDITTPSPCIHQW